MKKSIFAFAVLAACSFANAQTKSTTTTTTPSSTTTTTDTTTTAQPVVVEETEKTTVVEKKDDEDKLDKGGVYIEPMATYQWGEGTVDIGAGDVDSDQEGFGAGFRLGMHVSEILFVAADARYQWLEFDDFDTKGWNLGPVVGLQMPDYGMRIWGTYVLAGELEADEGDTIDAKFRDPKGWRLGAGLHVKSFSVNLEYQDITYEEFKGTAGAVPVAFDTEADDKSWIASISFPVEL